MSNREGMQTVSSSSRNPLDSIGSAEQLRRSSIKKGTTLRLIYFNS
jgi:hypothetical protein